MSAFAPFRSALPPTPDIRDKAGNDPLWLQADIQRPEIEVRFTPSSRHSGQGWEGLKLTQSGHLSPTHPLDGAMISARSANFSANEQPRDRGVNAAGGN